MKFLCFLILIFTLSFCQKNSPSKSSVDVNWSEYLGGSDRNHFSPLDQINRENVKNLKLAWEYNLPDSGQMQVNPLIIDGVVFGVSPSVQAFALNAETGQEIWKFGDPLNAWHSTSRGVSYWTDGKEARIFHSIGPKLFCLDAKTGVPIASFGEGGFIDLHKGLPKTAANKFIISNTPGTIFEDLIIMPVRLSEDIDSAPGDIRAFNVKTGDLAWTFHTIPYPDEFGYETFPKEAYLNTEIGAANNWAGMTLDAKNKILFVPTGSAAYDFYGGNRPGQNLFSNCLLALNPRTGERIWHYQTTHHDIWDRDLPAPPNLLEIEKDGKKIEVVAQITKQGLIFVFERTTGKPIFPIDEVPVPQSNLGAELTWPTQPIPRLPLPFARQSYEIKEQNLSRYAKNRQELINKLKGIDTRLYGPPSTKGSLLLPGYDGGAEWGGAAADSKKGILYVNSNEMPWILDMKPNIDYKSQDNGQLDYLNYCGACHGRDLKGNSASGYPSLNNISEKLNKKEINTIISNGKGRMPGFSSLGAEKREAIITFIETFKNEESDKLEQLADQNKIIPFKSTGYNKFLDDEGHPAIEPPWGTLNAIDLNSGNYLWKIPLGDEPNFKEKGTGTENYGGPIITKSKLLFIAATKDAKLRAFDADNGKLLWEFALPAASFATPSSYMIKGKQYLVLACGGGKLGTKKGNKYIAFALP